MTETKNETNLGNIFARLAALRIEVQELNLTKSGENDFAKFGYFELSDLLPKILPLMEQYRLCTITSFTKEEATMTVVCTDDPEGSRIVIHSPFGSADLRACHEVQNIGAVETYQRRYLWVALLEIVENDKLDPTVGDPEAKPKKKGTGKTPPEEAKLISPETLAIILDDFTKKGAHPDLLAKAIGCPSNQWTEKHLDSLRALDRLLGRGDPATKKLLGAV
jgi:hypothetical protein